MRRLSGLVPAMLVLTLLAAPAAADDHGPAVLAAEAEEPTGPDPMPREHDENPARDLAGYEDREVQFTWGAAWILLFAGAAGFLVLVGLYYLLVHRPTQASVRRR